MARTRGAEPRALRLTVEPNTLSVSRLGPEEPVPDWAHRACGLTSITRTSAELSIVCGSDAVPDGVTTHGPFRALTVAGPLDFSLTGILSGLATALAEAGVSLFAVSTYDTDILLVPASQLDTARTALEAAGHSVRWRSATRSPGSTRPVRCTRGLSEPDDP